MQGKLLVEPELFEPIKKSILSGLPVFGTCAGLLLLAKHIENDDRIHLATVDGKIVAAREGNQLAVAFRPELSDDLSVHEYFVEMIRARINGK